jgi:hypothetical protein
MRLAPDGSRAPDSKHSAAIRSNVAWIPSSTASRDVPGHKRVRRNGTVVPEGDGMSYDAERQVMTLELRDPAKSTIEGEPVLA